MRQRTLRYSIRAGRNLPDKEFRYLRTVIVTAAVYWGLSSSLWSEDLTTPLNLPAPGRSQSLYISLRFQQRPVFVLNSRGCHFTAAVGSLQQHPFFRSYGIILPSSLTKSHSRTLAFSAHPPVSDYGTVKTYQDYEDFLGSVVGSLPMGLPTVVSALRLPLWICLEERNALMPFPGTTFLR